MLTTVKTAEFRVEPRDRWQNELIRPLTVKGIFLQAVHTRPNSRLDWRLYFTIHNTSVSREQVKELIITFIQRRYEGFNLAFYRTADGILYASFDINVV